MTVGGIGGQKLHVGAVCSRAAAVTGGTGVAGGPKGSVQGSSSHFLRLFKVVRELLLHGSFGRLFLHMEERGNISDTCTCDDARAHTHREPKHTDTLSGTHMEISVQDSVENALPAHILRTQKCALHTHARAHARKHAPLVLHATPAVLPPHLPQVQDVKHGLKDPHTDGAAPPGGPDSPRRRWRGRGRVHRCNIRGVHRHRAPAALVAVLGA